MPKQDDNTENEREELTQFPNELDRLAVDDTNNGETRETRETKENTTGRDEQTDDTVETVKEATDELSNKGFLEGGLTRNETLALLGMTLLSYGFAWGLLTIMVEEGLHTVPFMLWALFGMLVVVPLMLLFGAEVVNRLVSVFIR